MDQSQFVSLLSDISALLPEQKARLRHELMHSESRSLESDEVADEQDESLRLQQELLDAGIISELRPPITDLEPYKNRKAVPILGEPISETLINERR